MRFLKTRVADSPETDIFQAAENELNGVSATRVTREVEVSFEDFIGVPDNALLCKTTTDQLAYRDGTLDIRGKMPRVPDEDKFEVGHKGG